MMRRLRPLGLLFVLLAAVAAFAPAGALAASAPAPLAAPATAAAPCIGPLSANTEITDVPTIAPTVIDVLANDCLGLATATRPLTITAVGQGAFGSVTTDGATVTYDPRACAIGDAHGADLFSYTITDGSSVKSGIAVVQLIRPATTPLTDAPQAGFVTNSTIGSTVPLKVSWCGVTAGGSSVKGYRLEQSTNAGASFPSVITAATTATSATRSAAPGTSYAWRVRTTDSLNRLSGFATSLTSRVALVQDSSTAIHYSSGWSIATSKSYSGGRERYTSKAGATATLTVSNVRSVAIVASRGAGRGSFNVYVDGVKVTSKAISEKASASAWRRVLFVKGLASGAGVNHTVQFRAVGNGRVDLDAILTLSGKRDQAITFTTPAPAAQYHGPTYAPAATTTSGLPLSLSVNPASWAVCSLSSGTVSFLKPGSCRIDASQSGDPTWNPRKVSQVFAVAPIPLTVTGITASDRAYNGTTAATLDASGADLDTTPVLPGEVVALDTAGATGAFTPDGNAGSGKTVQVAGLALTGTDAGNYTITQPTTTADITQAALTVTFLAADKPYDTTTAATIKSCTVATVFAGDVVSCGHGAATADFDDPNAGTNKDVTGSGFTLSGADAGNYQIVGVNTAHADITQIGQTITFTSTAPSGAGIGDTYDPTATSTSGLTVTITVDATSAAVCHITAGTVFLDGTGTCLLRANQAGDVNYTAAPQKSQSFAVGGGAQTISFDLSGVTATYGDAPVGLSATATSGLTVTFASLTPSVCTVSTTNATIVAAGTCTIRASQAGDASWQPAPSVDQSFTVDQRAITVTAVTDTKQADGTTDSAGVPTITSGTLASGDTGTWTQTFDTATVGTNKTLTPSGTVSHGGTDVTASYAITFVADTTGEITAGPADVTTSTLAASPHHVKNDGADHVTVTVQLVDTFGNLLTSSGGTVTIFATRGSMGGVTDHANGAYTATYTSDTTTGPVTFSADLDGTPLSDTDTINQN
jgi:hypothetical protein